MNFRIKELMVFSIVFTTMSLSASKAEAGFFDWFKKGSPTRQSGTQEFDPEKIKTRLNKLLSGQTSSKNTLKCLIRIFCNYGNIQSFILC